MANREEKATKLAKGVSPISGVAPPKNRQFGQPEGNPRHNGSWHKEDTPRFKIEQMMKASDEELEKIRADEKKSSFERAYANNILLMRSATDIEEAAKSSKAINDIIHEVYGKMPEMQITVEADDDTKEEASKIIRGFALP
jgi:hypothetical protein